MDPRCSGVSVTALFISFFAGLIGAQAGPTFLYHTCYNPDFSPNSTYQRNLNTILSTLSSSNTSDYVTGFASTTAGQGPHDLVNGLFLCRADVSASVCRNCVVFAAQDIIQRCPAQKVSVIWYDECLLSYSDEQISSTVRERPRIMMYNTANISEPARFASLLGETWNSLRPRVASGQSGKKFAVQKAKFNALQMLYMFAQCTPDLPAAECRRCLEVVIAALPVYPQGARVLGPSCNIRYETYLFYNETALELLSPTPPSPLVESPPPSPSLLPRSRGESKISTAAIIAIVLSISVVAALTVLRFIFLRKRGADEKFEFIQEEQFLL